MDGRTQFTDLGCNGPGLDQARSLGVADGGVVGFVVNNERPLVRHCGGVPEEVIEAPEIVALLLGYKNQLGIQLERPKGIRGVHDVIDFEFPVINEHRELTVESLCCLFDQRPRVLGENDCDIEAIVERERENADERARLSALHLAEQYPRIVGCCGCHQEFSDRFFCAAKSIDVER